MAAAVPDGFERIVANGMRLKAAWRWSMAILLMRGLVFADCSRGCGRVLRVMGDRKGRCGEAFQFTTECRPFWIGRMRCAAGLPGSSHGSRPVLSDPPQVGRSTSGPNFATSLTSRSL